MSDAAKTEDKPESEHINVKVTDSSTDVYFKIKKSTQLKKVFDAFCKRTGKEARGLRFLYEGERISEQDTPASVSWKGWIEFQADFSNWILTRV